MEWEGHFSYEISLWLNLYLYLPKDIDQEPRRFMLVKAFHIAAGSPPVRVAIGVKKDIKGSEFDKFPNNAKTHIRLFLRSSFEAFHLNKSSWLLI